MQLHPEVDVFKDHAVQVEADKFVGVYTLNHFL